MEFAAAACAIPTCNTTDHVRLVRFPVSRSDFEKGIALQNSRNTQNWNCLNFSFEEKKAETTVRFIEASEAAGRFLDSRVFNRFLSSAESLSWSHALKTTMQPSLLARASVNVFFWLNIEMRFKSRSSSIVEKVCSRRTTTYEASKRANSPCTSQVSRFRANPRLIYDSHKEEAKHTTKTQLRSSIEREVTPTDVLRVQILSRVIFPSLRSEGFSVLVVNVTPTIHAVDTITDGFAFAHYHR